jgi:hypothetical protein
MVALLALTALAIGVRDACPAHLFVIERSKNANIVVYDANLGPAGDFDTTKPVVVYWLLGGDKDRRENLTRMERDHAYGVVVTPGSASGTHALAFKALRKRHLTARMLDGCPVVTTSIGGQEGILRRLFVQSKEGTALPKVEYVELFGETVDTGAPLHEKYVPGK